MRPVAVVGTGITRFGRFPQTGLKALSRDVAAAAIADAGARAADVDSVFFANAVAGVITGQEMIRGQAALRETALAGTPIFNVENACASGSSAFHLAWLAVASGRSDCTLVVGAERLTHHDKRVPLDALARGVDLDEPRPPSSGGGSIFMELYAAKARAWMHETGVTREDLARVVVKSRMAAAVNPDAQFREPTTVEAVLGSRTVADPLTVPMCSGIGDGAAALLLCSAEKARRLGARPVWVKACEVVSAMPDPASPICAVRATRAAYERSGIGPAELHVVELHDASAPAELMHYENLGLCRRGEAGALLRSGATALGGRVPVNPGGGLLSRGHPIGATGAAQIVEIARQLRGDAGARQRPGARVGLAENNGGQIGHDAAVAVATLLAA